MIFYIHEQSRIQVSSKNFSVLDIPLRRYSPAMTAVGGEINSRGI